LPLDPPDDLEGAGLELVGRLLPVLGLLTVGAAGLVTGAVLVCVGRVCCAGLVVSLVVPFVGLVVVGLVVALAGVLLLPLVPGLAVLFIAGRLEDDGRVLITLSVPKPEGRVR